MKKIIFHLLSFVIFYLLSFVILFCIGIFLYGEYNASVAKRDREQRNIGRASAYTQNEYWPDRSDVKRVVTFPKQKPKKEAKKEFTYTKVGIIHPPSSPIEYEPRPVSARDYRESNQPDEFFKL